MYTGANRCRGGALNRKKPTIKLMSETHAGSVFSGPTAGYLECSFRRLASDPRPSERERKKNRFLEDGHALTRERTCRVHTESIPSFLAFGAMSCRTADIIIGASTPNPSRSCRTADIIIGASD